MKLVAMGNGNHGLSLNTRHGLGQLNEFRWQGAGWFLSGWQASVAKHRGWNQWSYADSHGGMTNLSLIQSHSSTKQKQTNLLDGVCNSSSSGRPVVVIVWAW